MSETETRGQPGLPAADAPFTLYGRAFSGNCYKPALMLSLCGLPFTFVHIDGPQQKDESFADLTPFGQVPVLVHGELVLRQTPIILSYLSEITGRFGVSTGLEAIRMAEWMCFEQDLVVPGVGRPRFLKANGGNPEVIAFLQGLGRRAIDTLERRLTETTYVAGVEPTIADIAIYCYLRVADEAGFDLADQPRTRAWIARIEALPGWRTPDELMPHA